MLTVKVHPVSVSPPEQGKTKPLCIIDQIKDDLSSSSDGFKTYALLGACKVLFLADRAEMSGLPHTCLYQGKAKEGYGDFAPWLVQLEPDATLTKELLSHSFSATDDKPDQRNLLSTRLGIFLKSEQALPSCLRKIVKDWRGLDKAVISAV